MKLSFAAIVGALVATVVAKPAFTNTEFDLQEGKPFTLNWVNATGPVTITLVSGPDSGSLQPVKDIGTGLTSTSLTFTPSGLKSGNYAFRINEVSSTEFNFSALIAYVGTGSTSASTAATTATTSVASTSSATHTITSASTTETSTTMKTSSTRTTATTSPRPTVAPNNNNNAGQRFSSPLALVIITVAALVFFN